MALMELLGSVEPRLKTTDIGTIYCATQSPNCRVYYSFTGPRWMEVWVDL